MSFYNTYKNYAEKLKSVSTPEESKIIDGILNSSGDTDDAIEAFDKYLEENSLVEDFSDFIMADSTIVITNSPIGSSNPAISRI